MNVFEDLIEELRDENLLEATVIDINRTKDGPKTASPMHDYDVEVVETDAEGEPSELSESDFFRKRAMEEISSLQMVEHVLSGTEREHMKAVTAGYDDLDAKKALHRFMQVQGDSSTAEYVDAEFQLMRETELWNTALFERDKKISVSNLRRFCENSRPALSSQALIALARFYRNTPYSELTRAKFDFVMTRLFSREIEGSKRRLLFSRVDMVGHIKTLYQNWASLALYSSEEMALQTRAVVNGIEERMAEAETADSFEQLVKDGFFRRVQGFKEATGEIFFAPDIVAATIDCNIRIGNKFVDLVHNERHSVPAETIEQKYGYEYDQIISEAAGQTFQLIELLKSLPDEEAEITPLVPDLAQTTVTKAKKEKRVSGLTESFYGVNKWLLAATILVTIATGGLYYWANQPQPESSLAEQAQDVDLDSTPLKAHLRSGRATASTFYAITLPSWDQLTDDQKKQVVQQAVQLANSKGLKNVKLVNVRGRPVAFASPTRMELMNPAP